MFQRTSYPIFVFAILTAAIFCFSPQFSYSQIVTPPDGGGVPDGAGQNNQNNPGGVGANAPGGRDGGLDFEEGLVDIEISENTRNQGFVGATSENIANSDDGFFVGAASDISGPPLTDGSFGGTNQFTPSTSGGGGGAGPGGPGGGFNAGGTTNIITRRNIRARLTPSFYAPRPSAAAVSNRFQSRFNRQPGSNVVGNGYSISVEGRTATVNGSVNSRSDSERIIRQLRLEPGVYNIVNRLSVSQGQQPQGQQPISTNVRPQNGFVTPNVGPVFSGSAPAFSQPIPNQIVPGFSAAPQAVPFNQTQAIQTQPIQAPVPQPVFNQPQGIIVAPTPFRNF